MNWLQEVSEWLDIFPFLDYLDDPNGNEKYQKIIIRANRLSRFLYNKNIPAPLVFKGQWIQFEWENGNKYLEIEVRKDNYHILFQCNGEMNKDENDFNILLKYIRQVYEKENNSV